MVKLLIFNNVKYVNNLLDIVQMKVQYAVLMYL
jgi:hypothetical protein